MSDILSEIYQPIVAHNISKGREIMKKNYGVVISLLFLFLFGCSSQDNKSNNHSTDDARLEPVEQAYDGCDKLLGSDHCSFKLPEKISKVDFNKVYSLSCNTLKNDDMTNAEKLFKTFYGDDFDESALSTDNGGIEAIKNIKIDKITVWDTGAGADGKGSTANFLSGLMQSVPPLDDLFKQAGMSLPDFLGEDIQEALKKSQEEAVKRAAEADNAETLDPKDVEVIEPEK